MSSQVVIKEFPQANLVGTYFHGAPYHAKRAFLIGCAMGITQKYYYNLADYLSESGFSVLTFDYRGTGLSAPTRLRGYDVNLQDWAEDIQSALDFLKAKNPKDELVFVGHSLASQLFGFVHSKQHVSRAIFLASSTGYWRDGVGMSKWKNWLLLSVVMPFSNMVWGYTNARFFKQGDNYPKGPSLQWRKWCMNPGYFEAEGITTTHAFQDYTNEIRSFYFSDDPIANDRSVQKLLDTYSNAKKVMIKKTPEQYNQSHIGHTGFLSRKFKTTLWQELAS